MKYLATFTMYDEDNGDLMLDEVFIVEANDEHEAEEKATNIWKHLSKSDDCMKDNPGDPDLTDDEIEEAWDINNTECHIIPFDKVKTFEWPIK